VFDVSFSELMVIAVVALLVIGPEKLPKVARTVGAFVGRMQRYVAQVKEEVNREVRFEELQKLQQEIQQSVEQNVSSVETAFSGDGLKPSIHAPSSPIKNRVKKVKTSLHSTPAPADATKKGTRVRTQVAKPPQAKASSAIKAK
jgi:sec-independent protein translocase protein TatB